MVPFLIGLAVAAVSIGVLFLLAPLIASLSFCCAPTATQTPKPDNDNPPTTWRDDSPRHPQYAQPPADETPRTWTTEAQRDPPAKDKTAEPRPFPTTATPAQPRTADAESAPDYRAYERPPALRGGSRRSAAEQVAAAQAAGEEYFDIPAFLRRQAD